MHVHYIMVSSIRNQLNPMPLTVFKMANYSDERESLYHGRRVGEEEKMKVRVVSGETNSILQIETNQL